MLHHYPDFTNSEPQNLEDGVPSSQYIGCYGEAKVKAVPLRGTTG